MLPHWHEASIALWGFERILIVNYCFAFVLKWNKQLGRYQSQFSNAA